MEDSAPSFPTDRLQAQAAWMRRLVRPLVRDDPAADDVIQDTWLAALRHPPVQAGRLRPWLRKVAVRRAWEVGRSERRRSQREGRASVGEDAPAAVEVVERAEIHARVVEALLGLPEIHPGSGNPGGGAFS
ncbi:MAG: RNA polymerase sigma factor [Planctomycetota bacterium]